MKDIIVYAMLMGALSGSDSLPFWATSNQWGLVPQNTSCLAQARLSAYTEFDPQKTLQWHFGVSAVGNLSANGAEAIADELYAGLRWKVLTLDLGIKHRGLDYLASDAALGSLSVSGGHLVESGNSRSLPGYNITLSPLAVPFTKKHLFIYGRFGDYITTDDRYVKNALVHRMQLMFKVNIQRFDFDFGVDHYAMWGGKHPQYGDQYSKVNLANYIRVVFAGHGGDDSTLSDQINVIGDHGGSEIFRFTWNGDGWKVSAQHDIPYSDGSGMMFQNFPDGINTIHFGWDNKDRWVSDIVYEYHYTMWQSGEFHDVEDTPENRQRYRYKSIRNGRLIIGGSDNYFNNGFYRSGWTYHGRPICAPLFFAGDCGGVTAIANNRYKAHHLGVSGKFFRKYPYKLMLTYSDNYGTYGSKWEPSKKQFSMGMTGYVPLGFKKLKGDMRVNYGLYADRGEPYGNNVGAMLGISYLF